jgi:hypothetical protein
MKVRAHRRPRPPTISLSSSTSTSDGTPLSTTSTATSTQASISPRRAASRSGTRQSNDIHRTTTLLHQLRRFNAPDATFGVT